jgi:transcriptional regulator with XRE-family HTH domain
MGNYNNLEFGKRLKAIAKEKYGSVRKLEEEVDFQNVSNYTSGKREPGASKLYSLCKLGIDINQLLTGEVIMADECKEKIKALEEQFNLFKVELYDIGKENQKLISEKDQLVFEISTLTSLNKKKINAP